MGTKCTTFFLLTATGDRQDSTYMYHVSHDIVDHVITKTYIESIQGQKPLYKYSYIYIYIDIDTYYLFKSKIIQPPSNALKTPQSLIHQRSGLLFRCLRLLLRFCQLLRPALCRGPAQRQLRQRGTQLRTAAQAASKVFSGKGLWLGKG